MSDFVKSADDAYQMEEIVMRELHLLKITKWKENPPTLHMWCNWIMTRWDIFIEQTSEV
jgi:hypothetical protein